jgi:hypothetical protein
MDEMETATREEHRFAPRFDVSKQVRVDSDERAVVRNISAQGIYFVSPQPHEVGSTVSVTVEYTQGGRRHELHCTGEVLRLELLPEGNGIAAKLREPFFAEG